MELTTKSKLLTTGDKAQGWPHGLAQLSSAQLQPHRLSPRSPKCVFALAVPSTWDAIPQTLRMLAPHL